MRLPQYANAKGSVTGDAASSVLASRCTEPAAAHASTKAGADDGTLNV